MGLQISIGIKGITIPLIIHYYLLKNISRHYTNLSTLNHNVRFLPCQHRGVGIMQYVYALNPVCIVFSIPGHSREVSPSGLLDIVNPGILMTIHRT